MSMVNLTCWTCEGVYRHEYGPGRPPKHCSDECRSIARKVRRRVAYVKRAEQRRARASA